MKSKKHRAGKRPKYNMRGCSKKRRKYLGGQNPQNYTPVPSTGPLLPNTQTSLNSKFQSGGQRGGATTFIGSPWSATNWPSANNANHYSMNTYTPVDIQLQTKVLGANQRQILTKVIFPSISPQIWDICRIEFGIIG